MRVALLNKLLDEFKGKFTTADVKQQSHNLLTTYKREKQRVDSSKSSGSGTSEVYSSNWDYFTSMRFLDVTSDIDESLSSLEPPNVSQIKKKKLSIREDEQSAKAQLWKALAAQLSQGNSSKTHSEGNGNIKRGAAPLEDRAFVFGRTVADSLLQCDKKHWLRK